MTALAKTALRNRLDQIARRTPPGAVADALGMAALCFLVVMGFSAAGLA